MNINKKILQLSYPNIISNITVPLVGLVDTILLGHLESDIYLAAIGISTQIFTFIYAGFGFLRMGTSGMTAQARGERNMQKMIHLLLRSLFLSISIAATLIILQIPIEKLSFLIVKGDAQVEQLASQYFYIRIWAAPATLSIYAFSGWFIGMQNAKTPMVIAIIVNLANIVFSYVFVHFFHLNSAGVALGTLIAQYMGLIFCIIFFLKYYKRLLKYKINRLILKKNELIVLMKVNFDIMIRSILLVSTFFLFAAEGAKINNSVLAANTLLMQFFMIFSYFIDGFAFAAESLVGKSFGMRNRSQIHIMVKSLFKWGLGISLIFSLIYGIFGNIFIELISSNESIVNTAKEYSFWIILIPITGFGAFIWDGIYVGATATKTMRNAMIISVFLVFVPLYHLLPSIWGNHGLWIALEAFLLARSISLGIMYKKSILNSKLLA